MLKKKKDYLKFFKNMIALVLGFISCSDDDTYVPITIDANPDACRNYLE
jgi:hypothetical protein